jgi:ion channel-forming bestrophin family protein
VPISFIARAIEIDLREMPDEENIPAPYPVSGGKWIPAVNLS